MDTERKEILEDTLMDIKFSGISWYKNEGFYYSSYDKPEGSELSAKTDQHKECDASSWQTLAKESNKNTACPR